MKRVAFIFALGCLMMGSPAWAASLSEIRTMWKAEQYPGVIDELLKFRNSMFGKNVEVDYMLATSFCRNPGDEYLGRAYLNHILKNYPLSPANRAAVTEENESCSSVSQPVKLKFIAGRGTAGGGSGVRGKMFYWVGGPNRAIGGDPLESIDEIPADDLKARLFPQSDRDLASAAMLSRLGPQSKVYAGENFVLGSLSEHTTQELLTVNRLLDKALIFIAENYSTKPPGHLLSAYLLPSTYELRKQGSELHGLNVAKGTIGYSFQNDLSVSAVVKGPHVGTLKHELAHLMIRTNFGDAPPWLDEGLASLYEVSRQEGDYLRGLPNWRGEVLKRFWRGKPTIAELMGMSWSEFDGENAAMEQQAVNHALARYWVLFLQDSGVLPAVYTAIRDRDITKIGSPEYNAKSLIESEIKKTFPEIEYQFTDWLQKTSQPLSLQDIKSIQRRLRSLGYSPGPIDGFIGSKTLTAIKRFQLDHGYESDGELDATTIGLLKSKTGR